MYIFFIRRFPDVDHLFPIIYRLSEKARGSVAILCQNLDYRIQDDFILNFLRKEFGIQTRYSYDVDPLPFRRIFVRILLHARRIYPRAGVKLFSKIQPMLYGRRFAESLLSKFKASAVVMDFDRVSKYSTGPITEAARNRNLPVVLLTHGVTMRVSGLKKITNLPAADFKIFPNDHKVDFFTDKRDSGKVKILGSPRYCDEWEHTYNKLLKESYPCPELPEKSGKLNVLFFERPNIGFSGDHRLIGLVEKLDFVNVVVKERLEKKGPYARPMGGDYPSARLVQWADVVIMSISSIALEVLWQEKTLIYAKYLAPDDVCVFDQYRACWAVNSEVELVEALEKIRENPGFRSYAQGDVERLFEDVVYAGDRSRDVLGDHADFLLSLNSPPKP